MVRKTGIVRKTFLFAALLIALVTLVSFAILYFAMPSFYLYKKEQLLKIGIENLEEVLKKSNDQETCASLIANFTERYNVTVTSIDPEGLPIISLSSPFVSMKGNGESNLIINGEVAEYEELASIIAQSYHNNANKQDQENGGIGKGDIGAYILYDIGKIMFFEADIGTEIVAKIQVQGTLQSIEEAREVILSLIPYALAAGCTIGFFLAWIYARQITKPILKLSATAIRMKRMEHHVVSRVNTGDELELLSENMNALYQSLSRTIKNLKIEMEKVNRLERSKTEMMQSASHELKTPIAALSGMLDGMIDNIGVYKDKEIYLLKCKEQVEKLSFLVKEILEASKTDRKGNTDKRIEIAVDEMVKQILGEFEFMINKKGIQVKEQINKVTIRTDPPVLYRAISNLISNAVMYTPLYGEIRIILLKEQLVIENQCCYIPETEMQKLFEPFYTRSSSRDKTVSGTGLGLYIVKRNLERLSISYRVESSALGFKITLLLE